MRFFWIIEYVTFFALVASFLSLFAYFRVGVPVWNFVKSNWTTILASYTIIYFFFISITGTDLELVAQKTVREIACLTIYCSEIALWERAENSNKKEHYVQYYSAYPSGKYADEARNRASRINQREAQARLAEKLRIEAERKAKLDAERKAQQEAERKAHQEAERKSQLEAERKAQLEAERKAQQEAARKAQQEAARKAQQEAARKAQQEAARKAQQEAARKAQQEAARKAQQEAARKAQQEAARKAQQEAARKAQQEAARKAQQEATKNARANVKADVAAKTPAPKKPAPTNRGKISGTWVGRLSGRPVRFAFNAGRVTMKGTWFRGGTDTGSYSETSKGLTAKVPDGRVGFSCTLKNSATMYCKWDFGRKFTLSKS
jgi:actin-related protein